MHRNWEVLNKAFRDDKAIGGRQPVEEWTQEELIEEINNVEINDTEFRSGQEMIEFTLGIGRYSEKNSFDYTTQDAKKTRNEGFFKEIYCPYCVQEATEIEINQDEIDPVLNPSKMTYTRKSFKQDTSKKEVTEVWYRCNEHPEFYLQEKEKEHL